MATSEKVDERADIYAMGCVAYWLLTGHPVFEADTPMAVIVAHANKRPLPPSTVTELDIPRELEDVILKCLEKKPGDRPQSAEELRRRLTACRLTSEWNDADARTWWRTHLPTAETDEVAR